MPGSCKHTPEAAAMPKCKPPCGKRSCPWCIVARLVAEKWLYQDVVSAAKVMLAECPADDDYTARYEAAVRGFRDALAKLDAPRTEEPAKDPRQKGLFDEG